MADMSVGTSWGFLECVELKRKVIESAGGAVQEITTRGSRGLVWVLRCKCGYEFEVDATEFPGRTKMRSCGRKGCTAVDSPADFVATGNGLGRPRTAGGRKSAISLYLPIWLTAELDERAKKEGVSLSEMVTRLAQVGMREEQR